MHFGIASRVVDCRRKKLLVGGQCFHKAVAVNGWQGMISHDVEIGCPHCGTLVVHILFDCLFAQTGLEVCDYTDYPNL
jgi:hypothetical protein